MTLEQIKKETEQYFDIKLDNRSRRYDLVKVRYLYYHLCQLYSSELTTYQKIGDTLGFDHATVIHGLKQFINIRDFDKPFKRHCAIFTEYLIDKYPPEVNIVTEIKGTRTNYLRRKIKLLTEELNGF